MLFEKDENLYFINRGLFYHVVRVFVPALEFYPWYVAPYQRIVPKLKLILFDFHDIARLFVNVTLVHEKSQNRYIRGSFKKFPDWVYI